jgi:TRAP-type mannitol/chloroaromatic compound transport system permease small subunit
VVAPLAARGKTLIIARTPRGPSFEDTGPQECPPPGAADAAAESHGGNLNALLAFSRSVDRLNEAIGKATTWLILIVVIISAGNAVVRYAIDWSNNGLLEIQWYLFSAIFLLMAGYVLKRNEHIRIDIIAGRMSGRAQNWIDVFGFIVFLVPFVAMTLWLSWPVFMLAWHTGETSANPGGLIRWPVRLLMPVGFLLLLLQGLAELIKRLAFLSGNGPNPLEKEKKMTAEEELAEEIRKRQVSGEIADMVGMADDMVKDEIAKSKHGGRP